MNRQWQWWLLAALGASWIGASPAEVYRCQAGAEVRYSDQPCAAGQAPIAVEQPNTMHADPGDHALARQHDRETGASNQSRADAAAAAQKSYQARSQAQARVRLAQLHQEVAVGMTPSQVSAILGEPAAERSSQTAAGSTQTWTFRDGGRTQTIRFKDGKVASVSTRTAGRRR